MIDMKNFRKFFKRKTNTEYWIPIGNVVITYDFQLSSPSREKFHCKERDFVKNGTIGKIVLNNNFELTDGYCTYLVLKKHGFDKIPVWFE